MVRWRRAGGTGRKDGTYGTHGTYAMGRSRTAPLRKTKCCAGRAVCLLRRPPWGRTEAVPVCPALSGIAPGYSFLGEGKGCPTLRGVCTRPLFWGHWTDLSDRTDMAAGAARGWATGAM